MSARWWDVLQPGDVVESVDTMRGVVTFVSPTGTVIVVDLWTDDTIEPERGAS